MTEFHNTSNDYSSSECYKFLYEYIKNYRDLDNNLLTKINKLTEEPGNENNKYWATILQKSKKERPLLLTKSSMENSNWQFYYVQHIAQLDQKFPCLRIMILSKQN